MRAIQHPPAIHVDPACQQRADQALDQALEESEARYRQFFAANVAVKLIIDPTNGLIVDANRAAIAFYGYAREQLLTMHIEDINIQPRAEIQHEMALARAEQRKSFNFRHRLASGEIRDVEVHSGPITVQHKELLCSIIHDISARKRAEAQLQLAAKVFENSQEGILITSADNLIVDTNPAFSRITGYTREETLGKNPHLLSSGHQDADFYAQMWHNLHTQDSWRGEIWNRRKNGEVYAEVLSLSAIRDANGAIQNYVAVFSDVSAYKKLEAELQHIAYYDTLTDIPNRRLLADRLKQAIARSQRTQRPIGICYLDLDGFKQINDQMGHNAGDILLVKLTIRLKELLRGHDTIARMGGDEFVILLTELNHAEELHPIVTRILEATTQSLYINETPVQVSASIGITLCPPDVPESDTLLHHADQAMYRAKENGKNGYWLFNPDDDQQLRHRNDRLERIEQALQQHEFTLYYQPKIDIVNREFIGVEALIRWQHPQSGLLSPGAFLPDLLNHPLDKTLGEWVIREALTQMRAWQQAGFTIPVSINISAPHLLHPDFTDYLAALLKEFSDIPPSHLELEISETVALTDWGEASQVLRRCHDLGTQISLDDFGTGYSSLAYFRNLPVNTIKINRGFVANMLNGNNELNLVESIIKLGHSFNRRVIAEGMETLEHGALLVLTGCRLCQGYGIAYPMPASALPIWVSSLRADKNQGLSNHDLPMILAAQSHRRWFNRIIEKINNPDPTDQPESDTRHCLLGRWYNCQDKSHYGAWLEFQAIAPLHKQMHQLANELIHLVKQHRHAEVRDQLPVLQNLHVKLLSQFAALIKRIAHQSGASTPPGTPV
jgi:diguanylate cyclase (GGDEF)-like protein/PAS domain S-box-containing protein